MRITVLMALCVLAAPICAELAEPADRHRQLLTRGAQQMVLDARAGLTLECAGLPALWTARLARRLKRNL